MTELSPSPHPDPDQKKIIQLYSAFGAGLILTLIPSAIVALVALLLIMGVLIAAYVMRGKDKDTLMHNHMTYVIRTIWLGGSFAAITLAVAGVYMFYTLDNAPLDPCFQSFLGVDPQAAAGMGMQDLEAVFQPCLDAYYKVNFAALVFSALIGIAPILLYFGFRFGNGLNRALKGYRIARPEAWF